MQMLYGYDVAADLAPQTRYDEVVTALGGGGETVTDPRADRSGARPRVRRRRALPGQRHHRRQRGLPARHLRGLSDAVTVTVRPVHADELAEVGRLTVAAYAADGLLVEDDPYAAHLRDAVDPRPRGRGVRRGGRAASCAGTVTFCPQGSPWSEVARPDEGEFRMLAVAPGPTTRRRRGAGRGLPRAVPGARLHRGAAVQPPGAGGRAPHLRATRVPPADGARLVPLPGRRPDGVPSRALSVSQTGEPSAQ